MLNFRTVLKDGRYQTLNDHGTPIDKLWRDHCCFVCQRPLGVKEHTLCSTCRYQSGYTCSHEHCTKRAAYRVTAPELFKGRVFCGEHAVVSDGVKLEQLGMEGL